MALNVSGLKGNERSNGDYLRKYVPQSRWSDSWNVFKSNFGKIVLINLFMMISFIPGITIMIYRSLYITSVGTAYPYNPSVSFPFYPDIVGLVQEVALNADLMFFGMLITAGTVASVGISGAAYSIRKLINTQGEFSVKSFFHGVKVSYFNTLLPVTLFLVTLFLARFVGDWKDVVVAQNGNAAGAITAYVFVMIATIFISVYCGWLLAVGVSYRLKFTDLIKNSFIFTIGMPIQTIIMAGFACIPVWFFIIDGFMRIISYILFFLFGLSFMLLSWLSYAQWGFDLFVEPDVAQVKEVSKAKTPQEIAAEKEDEEKRAARELLAAGKSELLARPIMPVGGEPVVQILGKTYSRAALKANGAARAKLFKETEDYEAQHMSDPVYAEYNKMFAERDKALQEPVDKKGRKKKRVSADNLLK